MMILVSHDNHIKGSSELTAEVSDLIEGQLERFGEQITRVIVQLSDESGATKPVVNDKRCAIEVRLAGLEPICVIDRGNSVSQVIRGATNKLEDLIESTLEKLNRRHRPVHPPKFEAVEETEEELDAEEAEVQV
jgi:ribosome-associated translation inhibitor RaiA